MTEFRFSTIFLIYIPRCLNNTTSFLLFWLIVFGPFICDVDVKNTMGMIIEHAV